jgi:hypothetical protein
MKEEDMIEEIAVGMVTMEAGIVMMAGIVVFKFYLINEKPRIYGAFSI